MMRKRFVFYVFVLVIALLAMHLLQQRSFPYCIPAADPHEYQFIQEWHNPWITVENDSVLVRSQEEIITTQPNRLAAVLRSLPASHWPHGRVVVLNPGSDVALETIPRKGSKLVYFKWSPEYQAYYQQCKDVLETLGMGINTWPF